MDYDDISKLEKTEHVMEQGVCMPELEMTVLWETQLEYTNSRISAAVHYQTRTIISTIE